MEAVQQSRQPATAYSKVKPFAIKRLLKACITLVEPLKTPQLLKRIRAGQVLCGRDAQGVHYRSRVFLGCDGAPVTFRACPPHTLQIHY